MHVQGLGAAREWDQEWGGATRERVARPPPPTHPPARSRRRAAHPAPRERGAGRRGLTIANISSMLLLLASPIAPPAACVRSLQAGQRSSLIKPFTGGTPRDPISHQL